MKYLICAGISSEVFVKAEKENKHKKNYMKLAITYAELQDYVASHFHKTVNLGYVDGATVS